MSKFAGGKIINMIQEDTSIAKYRLVKAGTSADEVVAATDATAPIIGVSDSATTGVADDAIGIQIDGTAKVVIASATTKGAYITATTGGKGVATTTDTNEYVGVLLETTTASNQVAEVAIRPGNLAG